MPIQSLMSSIEWVSGLGGWGGGENLKPFWCTRPFSSFCRPWISRYHIWAKDIHCCPLCLHNHSVDIRWTRLKNGFRISGLFYWIWVPLYVIHRLIAVMRFGLLVFVTILWVPLYFVRAVNFVVKEILSNVCTVLGRFDIIIYNRFVALIRPVGSVVSLTVV